MKRDSNYLKYIIVFLIIVIAIILFLVLNKQNNQYQYYEENLISEAKNYISKNNIDVSKEIYLTSKKIGIELGNDCDSLSGVFINNDSYIAYLLCKDYETDIVNNRYALNGKNVVFLPVGINYYEEGVRNITDYNVIGNVLENEGVYNLYYTNNTIGTLERKVIVINDNNLYLNYPNILLKGDEIVQLNEGEEFIDLGVSASDYTDKDITNNIDVIGSVNTNLEGEYKIIYKVTNSKGYTNQVERKIIVNKKAIDTKININKNEIGNEKIVLNIHIDGTNYDYLVLPDGNISHDIDLTYEVHKNDIYIFEAHDKDGKITNNEIIIDEFDIEVPNGSCLASVYATYVIVYSNPISMKNKKVESYNYIINGKESGFNDIQKYHLEIDNITSVKVVLKDNMGITNEITCQIEKMSSISSNGFTTTIDRGTDLNDGIGNVLARKGHTIAELNKCIYDKVKEAGPGTRLGVAAAGYGLVDCVKTLTGNYSIPYDGLGGSIEGEDCAKNPDICGKLGVNSKWGQLGGFNTSKENPRFGLNCGNSVHWAFCNGGMDMCTKGCNGAMCMSSQTYFPEGNAFWIKNKKLKYEFGIDLTKNYSIDQLLHMAKPGDVLYSESSNDSDGSSKHVMTIVGIDDKGIYLFDNGYKIKLIKFNVFTDGSHDYKFVFLDSYYANKANRNNLYN